MGIFSLRKGLIIRGFHVCIILYDLIFSKLVLLLSYMQAVEIGKRLAKKHFIHHVFGYI